jgi:hypothetical protein
MGDLGTVQMYATHGVPPDLRNRYGRTALHVAASQGHTDVIRYLISAGADVNAVDCMGMSPLEIATSNFREEGAERRKGSARLLADHGAIAIRGSEEQAKKGLHGCTLEDLEKIGLPRSPAAVTPR